MRQRLAADMRRQQQLARLVQWKAPAISGARNHTHMCGAGLRLRDVQQAADADATPQLSRIKATCAIQRCFKLVAGVRKELGVRVPVKAVYANPRLRDLAREIESLLDAESVGV